MPAASSEVRFVHLRLHSGVFKKQASRAVRKIRREFYAQAARVINSIHDEVHCSSSDDHCIVSSEFSGKFFFNST